MVPLHRLLSGILLVLWAVSALPAQEVPCSTRTVLATVIDREGNPVRGLTAADFRGEFRGHAVQIVSATFDTHPRRIVILLDASRSMTEEKQKWNAAKVIAQDLLRAAPPGMSVGLIVFAGNVVNSVGFAQGRFGVAQALSALGQGVEVAPKGQRRTALYDAISAGIDLLHPPHSHDVIYAVTDGGENASKVKLARVKERLLSAQVHLFAFAVAYPLVGPFAGQLDPEELHELVNVTGGNMFTLRPRPLDLPFTEAYWRSDTEAYWRSDEVRNAIPIKNRQLCLQMGEYYRMEIRLPLVVDKPRNWKLDVVDTSGRVRRDVEVLYPRRLMPCSGD